MSKLTPSEEKSEALSCLLSSNNYKGEDFLRDLIKLSTSKVIQESLEAEQSEFLSRGRYERGKDFKGYRNGYKPCKVKTAEGVIQVSKPQVRGGDTVFRSELLSKTGTTSQQLQDLIVEMYTRGLSTRDIEDTLTNTFKGFTLSKSSVSTITDRLEEDYKSFKERRLDGFDVAYLFLDMVYEPLRRYGYKTGVLVCWGIMEDGSRALLDLTTGNSESSEICLDFLRGMVSKGLRVPLTVTTDGAPGMISAVERIWPESKRIRCWFHKMQNLQGKVPPEVWPNFKALVYDMRDAPSLEKAEDRLKDIVSTYQHQFPEAVKCLLTDKEASLNHLYVPQRHQMQVRTTNLVERCFVEQRRRSKVIPNLVNEKSLTKLVFGTLIRVSERWSRRAFSDIEIAQIRQIRTNLLKKNNSSNTNNNKQNIIRRRSVA